MIFLLNEDAGYCRVKILNEVMMNMITCIGPI